MTASTKLPTETKTGDGLRIAVIGGGAAGISAAHFLSRRHRVILIEKDAHIGGHVHTAVVDRGATGTLPVDMGFIVFNHHTYPVFTGFLKELGVDSEDTDMSFAYWNKDKDFLYSGSGIRGLFIQKKNLLRPDFWSMLFGIRRFCSKALLDLDRGSLGRETLKQYLDSNGFKENVRDGYLLPMARAIWSSSADQAMSFPIEAFVRFFANHGLLSLKDRPQWRFVSGGSRTYVEVFIRSFQGEIRTHAPVAAVRRSSGRPEVALVGQDFETFDAVVLACHADQALAILKDPSPAEVSSLSPWRYAENQVVLHTDPSHLPPPKARACWNVIEEPNDQTTAVCVNYHMNQLQRLKANEEYIVSLNPRKKISVQHRIEEAMLAHPQYTRESLDAQAGLSALNGNNQTFFCGSYMGNGFHEDAFRSGLAVAKLFGCAP